MDDRAAPRRNKEHRYFPPAQRSRHPWLVYLLQYHNAHNLVHVQDEPKQFLNHQRKGVITETITRTGVPAVSVIHRSFGVYV